MKGTRKCIVNLLRVVVVSAVVSLILFLLIVVSLGLMGGKLRLEDCYMLFIVIYLIIGVHQAMSIKLETLEEGRQEVLNLLSKLFISKDAIMSAAYRVYPDRIDMKKPKVNHWWDFVEAGCKLAKPVMENTSKDDAEMLFAQVYSETDGNPCKKCGYLKEDIGGVIHKCPVYKKFTKY